MQRHLARSAVVFGLLLTLTWPARADDLADEADFEFSLGAEAYQHAEYKAALEHFLISNRLVANKNVVFNIARSYEQLKAYPAAFRYYTVSLEGETDPDVRAKINGALTQLKQFVTVLRVTTLPAGATLYIDRKDLGPRGVSPQVLGLAPHAYRLIAELPGYEPAEVDVPATAAGQELSLDLALKAIVGEVSFAGEIGAVVHIDQQRSELCRVPCRTTLPSGQHTATLEKPGFNRSELSFSVRADRPTTVRTRLEPLVGTAQISTDEPGTLVEVDGRASGFTPAILSLPVGPHRITLKRSGFRTEERQIDVVASGETRLSLVLSEADEVIAASRAIEHAEDAPSSVTLVGDRELSALAAPTIAEAVRGVPGVYLSDDRSYVTLGMRGLGRLGSYGNRILVTYDGQPMNDDWLGSSYVGYDALSDLGDVQRIEVVRGPGSVLYGTNALSGVINVVSRTDAQPGVSAGISSNQSGVARARVRGDAKFSRDSGAWVSLSAARGNGMDFRFPELATGKSATDDGSARGVDGFQSGTFRGRAYWKFLSAQWSAHSYRKHLPTAEFDTLLGDTRTIQTDTRSFVELRAEPHISESTQLLTRLHWNHYGFRGSYARDVSAGGVEVDTFQGSWLGLEQRLQITPVSGLRLTLGGEGQLHYQVEQRAKDDSGAFLDDTGSRGRPFQVGALYALADAALGPRMQLSVGARLDAYSTFGSSLNPRAALIWKPYATGNTKLILGKAFRAPSIYELYYNDGGRTQVQSPHLSPESLYSLEVEHSHRFSASVLFTVAAYGNYAARLISTLGGGTQESPLHYENERSPLVTLGGELGLRREFRQGAMFAASYGLSATHFLASNGAGDLLRLARAPDKRATANSPTHLASLRGVVPILNRTLALGSRLSLTGPRYDRYENQTDPAQGKTGASLIWDIVLSGEERRYGLRYAFGVYNAFDWRSAVPVSTEFVQTRIAQAGRSFIASLDAKF